MRGRKRLPTRLHVIHGTFRPDRHGGRDPQVPEGSDGPPEPPAWMTDAQRAGWAYAIEHAPRGILTRVDRGTLTMWVVAEDQHRTAARMQAERDAGASLPLLIEDEDGGLIASPYVPIMNKAATIMLKTASELGFSPAARSRLPSPPAAPSCEASPWDRFARVRALLDGTDPDEGESEDDSEAAEAVGPPHEAG